MKTISDLREKNTLVINDRELLISTISATVNS